MVSTIMEGELNTEIWIVKWKRKFCNKPVLIGPHSFVLHARRQM